MDLIRWMERARAFIIITTKQVRCATGKTGRTKSAHWQELRVNFNSPSGRAYRPEEREKLWITIIARQHYLMVDGEQRTKNISWQSTGLRATRQRPFAAS